MSPDDQFKSRPLRFRGLYLVLLLIVIGVVLAVSASRIAKPQAEPVNSSTLPTVGSLDIAISSTGRLSARSTIDVGSQVSGTIGNVLVGFNEKVRKGQILAEIDPRRYEAQLRSAEAALLASEASYSRALKRKTKVARDLARGEELARARLISGADLDELRDKYSQAQNEANTARFSIRSLRETVNTAQYDFDQTVIRSPVDGVVLDRLVETGQTVTASFETPVLFRIAEDLSQMQIELAVDEADIGSIVDGNEVQFTVDAFPERVFAGVIVQKRLAPRISGNNATYPVIVTVPNTDGTLIPGMLADARIKVAERSRTLKIPNQYILSLPDESPTFLQIQRAIGANVRLLDLNSEQRTAFAQAAREELAENSDQEALPPDLANFFGPEMASRVVVIEDPSGDPGVAMRNDRLRRLHNHFADFEETLSTRQSSQWDALLKDLVSSRYAGTMVSTENGAVLRPILVGMSDGTATQVLSGLSSSDKIELQRKPGSE